MFSKSKSNKLYQILITLDDCADDITSMYAPKIGMCCTVLCPVQFWIALDPAILESPNEESTLFIKKQFLSHVDL
eukprot:5543589-Amphidinium_carterae.1